MLPEAEGLVQPLGTCPLTTRLPGSRAGLERGHLPAEGRSGVPRLCGRGTEKVADVRTVCFQKP